MHTHLHEYTHENPTMSTFEIKLVPVYSKIEEVTICTSLLTGISSTTEIIVPLISTIDFSTRNLTNQPT
jgi:hypothetical protein